MAARERLAEEGEPLHKRSRKLQSHGENSIRVTLPIEATDILDVEPGDTVRFNIYADSVDLEPDDE